MKTVFLLGAALCAVPVVAAPRESPVGFAVGTASGPNARVRAFDGSTGAPLRDVRAGDAQATGGVRVALGDINGDGAADVVVGAGPGGAPTVQAIDGATGDTLLAFQAYEGFTGGVYVAAGDLDGDGRADVVTGAGAGGAPNVKVFDGSTGSVEQNFFAYEFGFMGGVSVAVGDFGGDGRDDIIVAPATGDGFVRIFDGVTNDLLAQFRGFDGPQNGMSLAVGRFEGVAALILGAGSDVAPQVRVFALSDLSLLDAFLAFDPSFRGGVNVAAGRANGRDTLFAAMASQGGTLVQYNVSGRRGGGDTLRSFDDAIGVGISSQPFGPDYMGGLVVSGFPAAAVPEPGVWLQLILGFGLAGSLLRARRAAKV
ncbi:FG-GAP-like repeat-containing protein [Glacieibacterium frigidum]|uniref:VCBS repeat-containing protein n=1 Tax=Glacieibacterium frigidum TaxID=2593303 RepID=A0A552UF84_9SPHN|nr:FG-GAP-like repeat-containing protein [Glacieibacterium frigidum]TRW16886.1 VCBS repeat-containing protein [Glacieibacterium frigidum]